MRRLAPLLALFVMAALPAQATADVRFRGQSTQGKLVTLRTGDDGLVERFAINWVGGCQNPRNVYREGTQTTPRSPFEVHTRERFVDVGGYRDGDIGDGLRAVYRARTVGNRVSERRWRGIFRIRVRVLRGDRLVDVCSARTRWRVTRRG
jgi:hypothetical protein